VSTYVFKAVDVAGLPAKGEVDAPDKQAVSDQLKARGLIVLDISSKGGARELNISLFDRVKAHDLTIFTRQLATMVSSGMSLLRTLYVLESQTESKKLKEAIVEVRKDVEAGLLFSAALERHPKVFGPLYVSMVRAGETGGMLEDALLRTADQLEKDDSLRRQVKSAMIYPSVIISFAMIVLLALVAFLVPVFAGIFKEFGGKLPTITQVTVNLSHFITHDWYIGLLMLVGTIVAFQKWRKSSWGRP
jgi:type IV pilus assembly protein PilC